MGSGELVKYGGKFVANMTEPMVLVGMFIDAAVPFLVGAQTMRAVGQAAFGLE
ncbi:hypothetical protein [Serratia marcescens]|uniref:hypothetical protein n=1 Tax=Serratia marcescens TaxID=615 RepID=UPI0013DA5356|nr:hypothetical protein [Serratia marcescens]